MGLWRPLQREIVSADGRRRVVLRRREGALLGLLQDLTPGATRRVAR
jgi:hypothetical protein